MISGEDHARQAHHQERRSDLQRMETKDRSASRRTYRVLALYVPRAVLGQTLLPTAIT